MTNKCQNCGYEYGEFDVYCSRCGAKIVKEELNTDNTPDLSVFEHKNKEPEKKPSQRRFEFFNSDLKPKDNDMMANFAIFLLIACFVVVGCVYFSLNRYNEQKLVLKFKNYMNNPQQIPELKEPNRYSDLINNLSDVEAFLRLYLKYSPDSIEKKEQVFAAYLTEMDKLPHLSNESILKEDLTGCGGVLSSSKIKSCTGLLNKKFKNTGVIVYGNKNILYLYPDFNYIKEKYSKYVSYSFKQYLDVRAKYNAPVSVGLELYNKPKKIADKIAAFEEVANENQNLYVKDKMFEFLYFDFRKFIFSPEIYATTTQEMKNDFKNAYNYYIKTKKNSALCSVVMSYLDKKRSYSEENFKSDYPYIIPEVSFEENVENSILSDVFAQLRKNIFSNIADLKLSYVYNFQNNSWSEYKQGIDLKNTEFVISEPDENNNIFIYNNRFSPLQELNISKYSKLFLVNNGLYIYNSDKLAISKVTFNSKTFNIMNLTASDVSSIFPGINVINIDSYNDYNIAIEKLNEKSNYIVLSKYSQGFSSYVLTPTKGSISNLLLPNMFGVISDSEVVISFHGKDVNPEETSENLPTYKIIIYTKNAPQEQIKNDDVQYVQYDEKTANDEQNSNVEYKPNIMPKIKQELKPKMEVKNEELLTPPPEQSIEPPKETD